jgi:ribonuclease BN (tRNA processing enzyme)
MSLSLLFLGVGGAQSVHLGSSNAVLLDDGEPLLMIDCGAEGLTAYQNRFGGMPMALFITHAHMDHVAGLERVFYASYFDPARCGRVRLYVPAALVTVLQDRLASYPDVIAEGGANFWDAFQLVPVRHGFWHGGRWFRVFPVRHHAPGTAYAIGLRGSFVWTGDTRPIPEQLQAFGDGRELIAHDCTVTGNPSHTGLADIEREYPAALRERLVLYHYATVEDAELMRKRGFRVASAGEEHALAEWSRADDDGRG